MMIIVAALHVSTNGGDCNVLPDTTTKPPGNSRSREYSLILLSILNNLFLQLCLIINLDEAISFACDQGRENCQDKYIATNLDGEPAESLEKVLEKEGAENLLGDVDTTEHQNLQERAVIDLTTASDTAETHSPIIDLVDDKTTRESQIDSIIETVIASSSCHDCNSVALHNDCGNDSSDGNSDDDDNVVKFDVDVQCSDENEIIASIIPEEFDIGFNTAVYTSAGCDIPCHSGKGFTKNHKKGTKSLVFVQALLTNTKHFDENIVTYFVDSKEFQKWRDCNESGTYFIICK